jgi:hypothetical protein
MTVPQFARERLLTISEQLAAVDSGAKIIDLSQAWPHRIPEPPPHDPDMHRREAVAYLSQAEDAHDRGDPPRWDLIGFALVHAVLATVPDLQARWRP